MPFRFQGGPSLVMLSTLLTTPYRCLTFSGSIRSAGVKCPFQHGGRIQLYSSSRSAPDKISTFGPDEPNILATEDDKDDAYTLKLSVPTPEDMEDVGSVVSMGTKGGDTILLGGDLGAGKTCFSRGFVRARTGDVEMRVTSPTYLLCNTYPAQDGILIHHMDLYRLSGKEEELKPLDMDHVLKECVSLIEWPSRLGYMTPTTRLDITFRISRDSDSEEEDSESDAEEIERTLTLRAHGAHWEERLRLLADEGYLDDLIIED
mmetsp:Transcript_28455/g.63303  ORF Transcript_28455/g.63303 Transcript_28455/m.63303 type:complete len:261 (-) Transcript_28455:20-802(-)